MSGGCAMAQDYLDGSLGAEERKVFEGHLAGCRRCQALVSSWKAVSEPSRAQAGALNAPPEPADLQRLMRKARNRPAVRGTKVRWVLVPALAAAAILAVVLWPRTVQTTFEAPPAASREVALGPDQLALPAGSRVVVLRSDGKHTRIRLDKGSVEAHVSHKAKDQSFVVEAGDVEVWVVGTRFKVIRAEGVRVEVSEGHVKVRSKGETYDVLAGQALDVGAAKATVAAMRAEEPPAPAPEADAGGSVEAEVARPKGATESQVERWKTSCDVRAMQKSLEKLPRQPDLWRTLAYCRKNVGDSTGSARALEQEIRFAPAAEADIARMYLADTAPPPQVERAMRDYLKRPHGDDLDNSARLKLAKALLAQHKDARPELERVAGSGTSSAREAKRLLGGASE